MLKSIIEKIASLPEVKDKFNFTLEGNNGVTDPVIIKPLQGQVLDPRLVKLRDFLNTLAPATTAAPDTGAAAAATTATAASPTKTAMK